MAKKFDETPEDDAIAASDASMDRLAAALTKGMTDAASATGPIKQIPVTKYINRNPKLNPLGLHDTKRPPFTREYYQNGKLIERWGLSDVDTVALNELRAGRYLDRKVEVIVRPGGEGGLAQVEIRYPSAEIGQRFEMMQYFRSFSELLRLIHAEQESGAAVA